jgi:3-oxoacyl-[acyl-carrier-protein] synthase-1
MPVQPIAIKSVGLVTSVGLNAPATCAAIRAKISNPTETRFIDSGGEWIMAHQVTLEQPWRGRTKLCKMAAMAIAECLEGIPREEWARLPLLLCVAERDRPGRFEGLDDQLFLEIQEELDSRFAPESAIITHGRVSVAIALAQARKLIAEGNHPLVLIAATDSMLSWPTLSVYEREDRLLTPRNSNGFMPGEGAGALLVGPPEGKGELVCAGVGFAMEAAHIDSGEPLRAEGLSTAIKDALAEAGCGLHDLDYRITDVSGEQYYFKEAALALSRVLRQRKEDFGLWHAAECIGDAGAVAGVAAIAVAGAAGRKAYAPGPGVLAHLANDAGQRAAAILRFRGA